MNKEILNIVITGGPCGGKTTALDEISQLLRSLGYTIYLVNETATELINDGIRPFGDNKLDLKSFQSLLLDLQIAKENIRRDAAKLCPNNKVAILYDRGILDNRSYIDDKTFDEFMKDRNLTESEILVRYDMVIHLVTAAIGKEKYYTTLNNTARTETIEQARLQDRKTLETWRNHPNLKIVGNDTLFDEKIQKVKNHIRSYIGEEEVINQERYLIDIKDIDLNGFNHSMIKETIEEFALSYDNDETLLFLKNTINNSSYYTCIKKKKDINNKTCRIISEDEYYLNKNKLKGNVLNKIRYNFIDKGERFRLDIFRLNNQFFVILERDVISKERKQLPEFIKESINITNNRDYDDDSIYIDYNINQIFKKH